MFKIIFINAFLLLGTSSLSYSKSEKNFRGHRGPGGSGGNKSRINRGERPRDNSSREASSSDKRRRSFASSVSPTSISSSGKTAKCADGNYVPLALLKLISENGNGVEIEHNLTNSAIPQEEKSLTIKVPSHMSKCAAFSPRIHQDKGKNTVTVTVENNFPLDDYLLGKGDFKDDGPQKMVKAMGQPNSSGKTYTEKELKELSSVEKFEICMTLKGFIVPDSNGGVKFKWPEIKGYSEAITEPINIKFNPNEDLKVLFASPREGGRAYGAAYDFDEDAESSFNNPTKCLMKEEVVRGGVYLWDETDRKYAKLKEDCQGSHHRIRNALKKLSDFPEKNVFRKILEKQLENELDEMAKDRYSRLTEIGKKIRAKGTSREEAEGLAGEYLSYIRELENYYLEPKVEKLKELVAKRKKGNFSNTSKAKLDAEIAKLNRQISSFSKGKIAKKMKVVKTLEKLRKLGLTGEANEVAEFKLKSTYYGRVNGGAKKGKKGKKGGKGLSFAAAEKRIERELARYRKDSELFLNVYQAKTGEGKFSHLFAGRIKGHQQRMQNAIKSYRLKEQKYMKDCQRTMLGSQRNPLKCKRNMSAKARMKRQRKLQSKLKFYQRKITSDHTLYSKFFELEQEGLQNKLAASREAENELSRNALGKINSDGDFLGASDPFSIDSINDNIIADGDGMSMLDTKGGSNTNNRGPTSAGFQGAFQPPANPWASAGSAQLQPSMTSPYHNSGGYNMYFGNPGRAPGPYPGSGYPMGAGMPSTSANIGGGFSF